MRRDAQTSDLLFSFSSVRGNSLKLFSGIGPFIIIILIWSLLSESGFFPREILVPPRVVFRTLLAETQSGELLRQVSSSLWRLFFGFSIGVFSGFTLGAGMALFSTVKAYVHPSFQFFRQVPTLALIPVFILFFGIGETVKIVLVSKAVCLTVALATMEGIDNIKGTWRDVAAVYEIKGFPLLKKVILPAALPTIMTGMRIALSRAWMVLIAAELLVSDNGIGQMLEWGRQIFRIDIVLGGVLIIGLIGFFLDWVCRILERFILQSGHVV